MIIRRIRPFVASSARPTLIRSRSSLLYRGSCSCRPPHSAQCYLTGCRSSSKQALMATLTGGARDDGNTKMRCRMNNYVYKIYACHVWLSFTTSFSSRDHYHQSPWSLMASATFWKPATLAPTTKEGIAVSEYAFPVSQHVLSGLISLILSQNSRSDLQHVCMISLSLASTSSELQLYR